MPPFNPAEFSNIALTEKTLWWFRGQREILRRLLAPWAEPLRGKLVLEGGCGTGYSSFCLEKEFGWRMVPIDLAAEGLSFARTYGVERLCQSDVARLPFPDHAFDGMVSLDVLVHFARGTEQAAFDELVRVVRPGGLFAVRVSALDVLRSRHSAWAGERQRFTRSRLIGIAQQAGITVERCTYANSLLMPAALLKFRVWEPLTNAPPASGVLPPPPWLNRLFHQALLWESRWLGAGGNLPVGQSLVLIGKKG